MRSSRPCLADFPEDAGSAGSGRVRFAGGFKFGDEPVGDAAGSAMVRGRGSVRSGPVERGGGGKVAAVCVLSVWGRAARLHRRGLCDDGGHAAAGGDCATVSDAVGGGAAVEALGSITLRPKNGIRVELEERGGGGR